MVVRIGNFLNLFFRMNFNSKLFLIYKQSNHCSKYNPIEHRVFPHVTQACQGVSFETVETAKHSMEKTKTTTGLQMVVRIIDKVFGKRHQYATDFKETMIIQFNDYWSKWNYTAISQTG